MQTINITGAPGCGKTTMTEALNNLHIADVLFSDGNGGGGGNATILVIDGTVGLTGDFPDELAGVFINKADLAEDIEMMELLEMELRVSLDNHGINHDTPVMTGSALMALKGDVASINQLQAFLRRCNIS